MLPTDSSKQTETHDSLKSNSEDAGAVAESIWADMQKEKEDYSTGKPSSVKAEFNFPELNLSAIGLHAINERTMLLYSGAGRASLSMDQLKHLSPDGSRYGYIGGSGAGSLELHWGIRQDQRYMLTQRPDKAAFGNYFSAEEDGRIYGDYHFKLANGDLETVYHKAPNSAETERKIRFRLLRHGGLLTVATGTRPSDHFALLKANKDAANEVCIIAAGKVTPAKERLSRDPLICAARDELLKAFDGRHTDAWTETKFKANMIALESIRMHEIQDQLMRQGTAAITAHSQAVQEIAGTYKQVNRLLKQASNFVDEQVSSIFGNINMHGRQAASCAEQIIDHAANPCEITQGQHPTCTAAALESRLYTRNPSEAARFVVDLACTGTYKSTLDKTACEIDKPSISNYKDSVQLVPADGHRGIASQIFQVGALNLMYRCTQQPWIYSQREADDYSETGDVLLNKKGDKLDDSPWSKPGWLQRTEAEIAGKQSPPWILAATERDGRCIKIENEIELEQALQKAKVEGNLPLALLVFTDHEPLRSESGTHGKESGGAHILCISDYLAGSDNCVCLDNQWESSSDHFAGRALSIKQTWQLMQNPAVVRFLHNIGF